MTMTPMLPGLLGAAFLIFSLVGAACHMILRHHMKFMAMKARYESETDRAAAEYDRDKERHMKLAHAVGCALMGVLMWAAGAGYLGGYAPLAGAVLTIVALWIAVVGVAHVRRVIYG